MTRTAQDFRVQREAAYWLSMIEIDEPAEADTERFRQWLKEHPANQQAYDEIARLWRDSAELTHLGILERPRGRRAGWLAGKARAWAAVAAVVVIGLVLILGRPFEQGDDGPYVTDVGEVRELVLADGSAVTLGPRSRLEVAFEARERRVVLAEGEAFFSIVPDAARPFVVVADGTRIRVVGTRFNVHEGPRGLTVAVAEGQVEVVTAGEKEQVRRVAEPVEQRRNLGAGEKVLAVRTGGLEPVEQVSPDLPGAWRSGRLVYENATLAEVVADANRYSKTPIRIGAPDLETLRVVATFRTSEIDDMIADLEASLPLLADRATPDRVVLRPRPEGTG